MKPLARRAVASFVCAALLAAQWPATAWAAAGAGDPNPAEVMKYLRDLGVYKDDADPLKTYLGTDKELTPIGRILFLSLQKRYNAAEEVESMKPIFDRLRGNGVYNSARQDSSARAMKLFVDSFGSLDGAAAGSVEESFRLGALREALMTGAAVADPPKANAYSQIEVPDGFEFWDTKGLAFRMNKNQVTTYNRELQKNQRLMNLNRPAEVGPIPETGRYNYEMLQYSYWRLKNQETEYVTATRIDRMIAIAELLGKQYPTDMWFNEKGLEEDLIRQAKAKTYDHRGKTFSVFDIVDEKFAQRRVYLEGVRAAVHRFETDMNQFKSSSLITDSQVATMSLDEQNALRWLSLTVLETQLFHVRNQGERVDPTSPDAQAIMKIVEKSDLSPAQKLAYKEQGRLMKLRLDELSKILGKTRESLNRADYAGSLDSVQAALASTQKELGDLSVDYSIYLEAPSTAFLAKQQTLKDYKFNVFGHLHNGVSATLRGAYKLTPWGDKYSENMKAIEGDGKRPAMAKTYAEIAVLVSSGNFAAARQRVMEMNPNAAQYSMSGAVGGEPGKINDALRISSSLKASHDRITAVTEVNKSLDAAATFVTWTVSIALLAPVARATLNGVGRLSSVGSNLIIKGKAMGGVSGLAVRAGGRTAIIAGEIAKHTAARLGSLEPDAGRVRAVAGETWIANYAVASGARAISVATRQATFTALSGGISAGFTVGTHLWDVAAAKVGGVNIGGWQAIEPGHSMFSNDWDGVGKAAWAGFKGGAWWANESFHPALGYIGLPSTVFSGTRWAGAMDIIGTRGVVGSASHGLRVAVNGKAAVEAAASSGRMGLLEKMTEAKWYTGKPALAFGMSMADNVAKYALFSQAAAFAGQKFSWYAQTNVPLVVPFVGQINTPETDIERRIKRSNQVGQAALESPAWLLIPTHSAHGARDAGPYRNTREGMRQYDAVTKESPAGRTAEYANAPVDSVLKIRPVKPPVSQRLFEARFFGELPASEFIVTKAVKEAGQLKEITRLAKEGGIVNPIELMAVRQMKSGEKFRTLEVTDEVQKFAYEAAKEGLVSQPARALEALTVKPGNKVKGWGEITPELQIEFAKALSHAEGTLGRKLTPALSAQVRTVLKDHLLANKPIGTGLRAAVTTLPREAPKLDKAQKEAIDLVLEQEAAVNAGKLTYGELTVKLREMAEAKVKAGELSAHEGRALTELYDFVLNIDRRFNAFNRTDYVQSRAEVIFDYLAIKFSGRPEMVRLVEAYRKEVGTWADTYKGRAADGAAVPKDAQLSILISRLESDLAAQLKASPGRLAAGERAALEKGLQDVKNSAWVVRDASGSPIPSWRAKQYVRLMQSFLGEGSHAKFVNTTTEGFIEALRADNKGRTKMLNALDGVEADIVAWVKSREGAPANETGMGSLITKLRERQASSVGELTSKEGETLSALVDTIAELDRPGLHNGILTTGRKGGDVQLFLKAPTSLGKTLLAFEGLLPYLEAEAAASGREIMFLTFNTKLQAQAEFDFLAFNKLGSKVTFETYEGLKTRIAEGKTKGINASEKYLMLQDEMDAAGQQPALTIGMVSGRVSRLNGQTTSLNDSNAGLAWGMSRLDKIRVEAAEVQAQRIKSVTSAITEGHVEPGQLAKMKSAANDVLEAVGQLKKAKGPAETALAEKSLETGMSSLRRMVEGGGLPAAESDAASTILAGLGRMTEALAERPATNPVRRAQLAGEMETAFRSQSRVMNLTNTSEGLNRLPAEARKARMALETRIDRLGRDIAEAEAAGPKGSTRATLLREQLEFARLEKKMVERFDGVDVSARLMRVDEHIASIRSGQAPGERLSVNPKLSRLVRESVQLEAKATPEAAARRTVVDGRIDQLLNSLGAADAAAVKSFRAEMGRAIRIENLIERTEASIKSAKASGKPVEGLEARLTKLNEGLQASKGQLRQLEVNLGAVKSSPKLDGLVAEAQALEAGMTPQRRASHQEYRTLLEQVNTLSDKIGEANAGNRAALEAERATARGRLRSIELELSAAPAKGDLGGTLRRIQILSSESARLERQIMAGEAKGESVGALKSELRSTRREETALRREARAEILKRFDETGAEIVALTREGKPGWDAEVNRLLERRRALQESYAGDESAMYTAYREMKENARPIAENPRLTEKPYEIPGGEGWEPAAALKRADFLIDRARKVEAKPKGGGAGQLESQLLKARSEIEALSAAKESPEFMAAMERMRKLEVELLRADSFHTADVLMRQIDGAGFVKFLPSLPKFLWQAATGKLPSAPTESMGLTRYHAAKMLKALANDPMMPAHQRDNLMWSYLGSLLLPKGVTGRGTSYVRSEVINMVQGFHDSAAGVRVDNKTGKFNVVHNGQWFESMDNASRRWWELHYGTDLTLPYTHNSMSTIRDVTTNKKSYFISLSGTAGNKFEAHLHANKISIVGEGSAMPKNVLLEVVSTPEQRGARVVRTLGEMTKASQDMAVLRKTDIIPDAAKKSIEEYMAARGLKPGDPHVIKISDVSGSAAQTFLQGIRASQKNTSLLVLSVSNTRELRKIEAQLKKSGIEQKEIAKVFADTEFLRQNVPEAKVLSQMNIEGLNNGQVKVLILDTRVGGRGLDLNFKGERNSTRPDAFRGYTTFEMLVLGPEEMSAVHMVQAMGRIDTGRTLSQAPRQFTLLMDIKTAKAESVFRNMYETEPFFVEMRKDPTFQQFVRSRGGKQDWHTLNDYILHRAGDKSGEGQLLAQRADKAVRESLSRRNLEVEENLLRQANVLTDAPTTQSKNPALDRIR